MSVLVDKTFQKIMNKPKLDEIVVLRGIACIYVMLVHITSEAALNLEIGSVLSIIFSFINTSSTYVVPAFIFLSGFTLFYRYKDCKLNILDFYYKRFKSTLIPYIICTVVYYAFFIKFFNYEISLKFLLENLMLGTMVYHLYFVIIILQFYLLFPIILAFYKKFNALSLTIIMLLLSTISHKFVRFEYSDRLFLDYIFFFSLGCSFVIYKNKIDGFIKKYKLFIVLLNITITLFYCIEIYLSRNYEINLNPSGYTWYIFCVTSIFFYYCISMTIAKKASYVFNLLKNISANSYTIYLAHPIILMIIDFLYQGQTTIIIKTILKAIVVLTLSLYYSQYKYIFSKRLMQLKRIHKEI